MPLTKEQQAFVDMMNNSEVKNALGAEKKAELEDLLKDIPITDDDDMASLNKKQQTQLQKVVKYFTKALADTEKNAVATATADSRKAEDAKIATFSKDNPGMKNSEVVDLMQVQYDKGKSLEDSYKIACKALDLDPVTGVTPKEETAEEKKAREVKEAKEGKPPIKKSSNKSTVTDDPSDLEEEGDKKKVAPKTLEEALAANSNAYIAKHGNPFEESKE
jgi:hypothetical protein